MEDAWKQFRTDFNALTDEQIEDTCKHEQSKLDEAETWLEAVASWKAAGKPRDVKQQSI
jgi:DNA phosphorothioation-dependent restriction protein DptG